MHGNRTRLRQELMKQALELERQRDEDESRRRRNMAVTQQSSTISVPSMTQSPAGDVTLEVPNDVLKVSVCVCCLLYTSPSPRDATLSRMPSSA